MQITRTSMVSKKRHTLDLPIDETEFKAWENDPARPYVQDRFPELSAGDREFLISGVTPEEWEKFFASD